MGGSSGGEMDKAEKYNDQKCMHGQEQGMLVFFASMQTDAKHAKHICEIRIVMHKPRCTCPSYHHWEP